MYKSLPEIERRGEKLVKAMLIPNKETGVPTKSPYTLSLQSAEDYRFAACLCLAETEEGLLQNGYHCRIKA